MRERGFSVEDISKLMSSNIAAFIKMDATKGRIEKGYDADIIVWDPNKKFKIETSMIQHRHKITPYDGLEVYGEVEQTYVNGIKVYDGGNFTQLNAGEILLAK